VFFIGSTLSFGAGVSHATDVILTCVPSSQTEAIPNRKVGQPMSVRMEIVNDDCDGAIDYGKISVGLVGNAGGTLANVGIYGPFKRGARGTVPIPICVPIGQCTETHEICSVDQDCASGVCEVYGMELVEASTETEILSVTDAMPAALAGTVARVVASFDATDSDGESVELLSSCRVNVVP
jgi:hypothetical protein